MSKTVTICGSMRFQSQMMALALKLELEKDYAVIQCVYSENYRQFSPREAETIRRLHYQKIAMSDAVFVVNAGGYIGQSTKEEIAYARSLHKEILYLKPPADDAHSETPKS